jgi:hypothetical protein
VIALRSLGASALLVTGVASTNAANLVLPTVPDHPIEMPSNPPLKMGGKVEPEFNGSAHKQDADGAAEGQPRSDRAQNQSQTPPAPKFSIRQKEGSYQTWESEGKGTEFFYLGGYRLKVTDSLVALFTGLLVLVGGIQAYRLRQTVLATREAAGALPALERAYLFLSEEIGKLLLIIGQQTPRSEKGNTLSLLNMRSTITARRRLL